MEAPATPDMFFTCYCGVNRFLPLGLKDGDTVDIAPCRYCGTGFRGQLQGQTLQEVPYVDVQ
jgi:hypothetical protein